MGGLGPGIGASELFIIGLVALLVVGPKDLPVLLRRLGQWTARARNMAAEFRASFDEMARQSELDDLRKEVEALRHANPVQRLGAEADAAFKDIRDGLNAPATPASSLDEPEPVMTPLPTAEAKAPPKPKSKPRPRKAKAESAAKPPAKSPARTHAAKPPARKASPPRPRKIDL